MCWSKFNLLSNLTPRYFVESDVFIGMSFIKIFGNAGSIFNVCVGVCALYIYIYACVCVYVFVGI